MKSRLVDSLATPLPPPLEIGGIVAILRRALGVGADVENHGWVEISGNETRAIFAPTHPFAMPWALLIDDGRSDGKVFVDAVHRDSTVAAPKGLWANYQDFNADATGETEFDKAPFIFKRSADRVFLIHDDRSLYLLLKQRSDSRVDWRNRITIIGFGEAQQARKRFAPQPFLWVSDLDGGGGYTGRLELVWWRSQTGPLFVCEVDRSPLIDAPTNMASEYRPILTRPLIMCPELFREVGILPGVWRMMVPQSHVALPSWTRFTRQTHQGKSLMRFDLNDAVNGDDLLFFEIDADWYG